MDRFDCKNYLVDPNEFDVSTISYNKPIDFYKVNRNMGIYYQKNPESPKSKIIIRTPKMLVPFDTKEFKNDENGKKTYKMCLSFSPLTNLYNEDEIKKFYKFVKQIDKASEETILSYRKKWNLPKEMTYKKTLRRITKDYPHYMGLSLPYDEQFKFLFKVYDENALESNLDIITKRSVISAILELTDLRFSDNEFRANWTVLQIRKFNPYSSAQVFFMTDCFIRDPNDEAREKLVEQNNLLRQQQLQFQQMFQNFIMQSKSPEAKLPLALPAPEKTISNAPVQFVPPSQSDLLSGIKKLKKTVTVDKSSSVCGRVVESEDTPVKEIKPSKKSKKKSHHESANIPLEFDID
jgi:hypothetical protein